MKVKYNEPLGVPQGTIRAVIAIVVILNALVLEVLAIIKGTSRSDFAISLAGVAFGYYFGARQTESEQHPRQASPPVLVTGDDTQVDVMPDDDVEVDDGAVTPGDPDA